MNVISIFYVFTKITSFWHCSYLPLGVGANNLLLMSNDCSRDAYDGGRGLLPLLPFSKDLLILVQRCF